MNKCDLEETKKQVEDIIAAAIADASGWVWHNGRRSWAAPTLPYLSPYDPVKNAQRMKSYEASLERWCALRDHDGFYHDLSGVSAVRRGGEWLNPPREDSPRFSVPLPCPGWRYSTYHEERFIVDVNVNTESATKEPLIPEEPKFAPVYWSLLLNGANVGKADGGSERFAFFEELKKQHNQQMECERLLRAMNPPKKATEAPTEEPEEEAPDTSSLATTLGAIGLFGVLIILFAAVVCSSTPTRPVSTTNTPVETSP